MKIFYIPSGAGFFHEPIDQAILETLGELNIETSVYDLVQTPNIDYLRILHTQKPDLILTLYGSRLDRTIMQNIHQTDYKTALWLVDDPYEVDTTLSFASNYDFIFTIEENCIPLYQNAGSKNVHWLPLATLPSRFKSITVEQKYRSDICIVGTAFQNRLLLVDQLADYFLSKATKIIGRWWERLENYQRLKKNIFNQLIKPNELVNYYNGAKINVNIHRIFNIANSKNIPAQTPNNRTFDIAACNAFQLTDCRQMISQFYIPNQEMIIFRSVADLKEKIDYYLLHDREREQIASSARLRTLTEHTFLERLRTLIKIVNRS